MQTLYNWEKTGKIEIIRYSEKIFYNVEKYLKENKQKTLNDIEKVQDEEIIINKTDKINICYVRVSTHDQKDDLERQKEYMKKIYEKNMK